MLSRKKYWIFGLYLIFSIFISSFITLEETTAIDPSKLLEISTYKPIVYVDCPEVANVEEIVAVHVKVFNLNPTYVGTQSYGDLYGLDINFTWNPIILEYINHTVKIPVETYPDGVLHSPVMPIKDIVNSIRGTYNLVYASMAPAPPFNNPNASNTIFTMFFRVRSPGGTDLTLRRVKLSNKLGNLILREVLDGALRTPTAPVARFTVFPDSYPVVNKRVEFNASISYDPDGKVTEYIWDFGDGNVTRTFQPIISHEYKSVAIYNVKLRVIDDAGLTSSTFSKSLQVVQKRNLAVKNIKLPSLITFHGEKLMVNVTVENNGYAPETFKVSLSYNATMDGNWTTIQEKEISLDKGKNATLNFLWDTGEISEEIAALNCSLFLLANITIAPHEEDVTDNLLKSTYPIRVLFIGFHDVAVLSLKVKAVSSVGKEFAPPLIKGERLEIFFKIKTKGNQDENYSINVNILMLNGSIILSKSWENEFLEKDSEKEYIHLFNNPISLAGNYTFTVNVTINNAKDERPFDNFMETSFEVIEQPRIQIMAPKTVYTGEEVTFRVNASNIKGPIRCRWTRIKPGGESEMNRRERKDVTYIFNTPGNWTIRLIVTDGYGITYNTEREATVAYMVETTITAIKKPEAITLGEWTPVIAGLIIAAVFVAAVVYLKLRRT